MNKVTRTRSYQEELLALLQEPIDSVLHREKSTFDALVSTAKAIVLFGAGNLGRKLLAALRRAGIEPAAFADNNSSLWGKQIEVLAVLSPEEIGRQFCEKSAVIITVWTASEPSYSNIRSQLHSLGCFNTIPFMAVGWKWPDGLLPHYCLDLPHKIIQQKQAILNCYQLLADETSQCVFVSMIRSRLWLDFDALPEPTPNQYFPAGVLKPNEQEFFVDCGAFDGDTIRTFLAFGRQSFRRIVAVEPDAENFSRLEAYVQGLAPDILGRISLLQVAARSSRRKVRFRGTGDPTSRMDASGEQEAAGCALDEILVNEEPTFIKMDIEGGELDALMGAQGVIKRHNPVLAVCVYHQPTHLWEIPLFIASLSRDYSFFLRVHAAEGPDVVCYAIPPNRLTHRS